MRVTTASAARMQRLCDALDDEPKLWAVYADDFRMFIDAAIAHVGQLQTDKDALRGSFDRNKYASLRSAQTVMKQRLWNERPHVCEECGAALTWKTYCMHHIMPVRDGGGFEDDNLLMLCANCHALRH